MKKVIVILLFIFYTGISYSQICQAVFFYTSDTTGLVTFTDSSTAQTGTILSWFWDFGNGSTSTLQNVTHQFTPNSTNFVCLTIATDDSCVSTFCDTVIIGNGQISCIGFGMTYSTGNETGQGNDGVINLTVYGGVQPYSYVWDNGMYTQNLSGLSGGIYCVTVTDTIGCNLTQCITVYADSLGIIPCQLNITSIVTNTSSVGTNNGSIDIIINNGLAPYFFLWNNGDTTQNISNLDSGLYCVSILSSDTCTIDTCFTVWIDSIIDPCTSFSVSFNITNTSGVTAGNGSITTNTVGGTPPYTYIWDSSQNTADIQNLSPGIYCITVIDINSCVFNDCVDVLVDTLLFCNAEFNVTPAYCPNCFGFNDISVNSGNVISWYWDFGDGNSSSLETPEHFYQDSGYYNVCLTIQTIDSCVSTYCENVYAAYNLTTYSISGNIFADSILVTNGTVELYNSNLPVSHPPYYSEIITGGYYNFPAVASGSYKLLAIPEAPYSDTYSPTYFGNAIDYNNAYSLSVIADLFSVDVYLQNNSGIIENNNKHLFNIYPNPFKDYTTIEFSEVPSNEYDFVIYNIVGIEEQRYSAIKSNILKIHKADLKKGIYLGKLIDRNQKTEVGTVKLVIE